eukprot:2249181-Prymnesium_polylepis.2
MPATGCSRASPCHIVGWVDHTGGAARSEPPRSLFYYVLCLVCRVPHVSWSMLQTVLTFARQLRP